MSDLFAPEGGWQVRILDNSGGAEDGVTEEIGGFLTLMHANAFARAYVRDSIESCRQPGLPSREVLNRWFAFGEDAQVIESGDDGWSSANELADFADRPAPEDERDWRGIDPRRDADEDDADDQD